MLMTMKACFHLILFNAGYDSISSLPPCIAIGTDRFACLHFIRPRTTLVVKRARYLRTRSNLAFTATTTVLTDISTAPIAGLSRMPKLNSTPAANGIAIANFFDHRCCSAREALIVVLVILSFAFAGEFGILKCRR